jgi:membrane-associated phospholipid phosphatase
MFFGTPFRSRRRLFFWIACGLLAILAAFAVDGPVTNELHLQSTGALQMTAVYLSVVGDWPFILLAGLLCVLGLLFVRRFEPGRLLLLVLVAGMISGFAVTVIRSTVGRTRPDSQFPQGFYGLRHDSQWTVGKYEFGSFPSGHTATAFGLAAAAWVLKRRWGILIAIFAAAVAWSRLALGCHHFSDVVAAAVWSVFVGPCVVVALDPWLKSRWAILQNRWWKSGAVTIG